MPEKMTIDALARVTGMTVRNIRAHQSRGLLQPPEIQGRTGYYGPEHVARIELISEMQADGFNLAAIKRLLEIQPGSDSEMLGIRRALMAPWEDEEPEFITAEELRALGIDNATALDVLEEIARASRSIARAFVKLFLEEVWRPFADSGQG